MLHALQTVAIYAHSPTLGAQLAKPDLGIALSDLELGWLPDGNSRSPFICSLGGQESEFWDRDGELSQHFSGREWSFGRRRVE